MNRLSESERQDSSVSGLGENGRVVLSGGARSDRMLDVPSSRFYAAITSVAYAVYANLPMSVRLRESTGWEMPNFNKLTLHVKRAGERKMARLGRRIDGVRAPRGGVPPNGSRPVLACPSRPYGSRGGVPPPCLDRTLRQGSNGYRGL